MSNAADSKLKKAFQYHHRHATRRYVNVNCAQIGPAIWAIEKARADVAAGVTRYPATIRQTYRTSESSGLRYVGRVVPDTRRGTVWDSRGDCGWHTDPYGDTFRDGSGLCFGVVYQLPARNGESRFVAGYEFGGMDGGPTLDLGTIYTEPRGDYDTSPCDIDAARDAAISADSMAKNAAEQEREYQTAWQAGSRFASLGEDIADYRKAALQVLAERRAARGTLDSAAFPTLCATIRRTVADKWQAIQDARAERAELAAGDSDPLYFWSGEARLRDAFCEGAGLESFPEAAT